MTILWPEGSTPVIAMAFGSHVYGTDLPSSDHDVKGVFIPAGRDILLQEAEETVSSSTKADPARANTRDDVDTELFSLQRFLGLLIEGQTNAIDMLFTPTVHYAMPPHPAWVEIQTGRGRLIHSGVSMFARYCRHQAAKYGIKGSRIAALRTAIAFLEGFEPHKRLEDYREEIEGLLKRTETGEQLRLVMDAGGPTQKPALHLEVSGRKVPMGATVKLALQNLNRSFGEFGQRALLAEKNQGVDWKALMHAVRVAREAEELLSTGLVTFPRPERDLLLRIRQGELPYAQVAEIIEAGVGALESAAAKSKLPAAPDRAFADSIVCRHHAVAVAKLDL